VVEIFCHEIDSLGMDKRDWSFDNHISFVVFRKNGQIGNTQPNKLIFIGPDKLLFTGSIHWLRILRFGLHLQLHRPRDSYYGTGWNMCHHPNPGNLRNDHKERLHNHEQFRLPNALSDVDNVDFNLLLQDSSVRCSYLRRKLHHGGVLPDL